MNLAATDPDTPRLPLGVGRILRETVTIVWTWKGSILALGLPPILALNLARYALVPEEYTGAPTEETMAYYTLATVAFLIIFPVSSIVDGLVTTLAYAAGTKGTVSVGDCIRSTVPVLLPLIICDSAVSLGYIVGLIALVVPGLYLLSIWIVLVPCIVLEDAGYRCFERSARLTKGYRWPCLAVAAVFVSSELLASLLLQFPLERFTESGIPTDTAIYLASDAVFSLLFLALFAVASTLTYLRLRDIKEGTVWLADVFD